MQSISYVGDGSTTEFNFNFPYYENTNIIVTLNNTEATGYTIVGTSAGLDADIPYSGGKVVFDEAPSAFDTVKISRSLPLTRVVDYQPTEKIETTSLNQDMNYMMEVLKDFSDKLDNFSAQYSEIVDKETTQNLIQKMANMTEKINEFEDEVEDGYIMSKDSFYSYMTNCVTEIPQDIKLELNNGTLTLKSGSKIYKPNGDGVFDTITTTEDKTKTISTNDTYFIFLPSNGGFLDTGRSNRTCSGASDSLVGTAYHIWYDTTNNIIKRYDSDGTTISSSGLSFPICTITVSGGSITSINKIFNGFGYIGSTIFGLPGVKCLVPNGLNDKGILNNVPYVLNNVITYTQTSGSDTLDIVIDTTTNSFDLGDYTYDSYKNYNYYNGSIYKDYVIVGNVTFSSGVISVIDLKKVFSLKLN